MTGFIEPFPTLIAPNPGGLDDPLGESVLDSEQPFLRVFTPTDVRVVIGRHQDPNREVRLDAARADGVPVHRRVSGGGTVVLAPGMVVVALRLRPGATSDPNAYFSLVNSVLIPAVHDACGASVRCRGFGDLTVADPAQPDAPALKVLGASLRQTSRLAAYLGVFLVEDATVLMERLLPMPSKQPDYRGGRGHRAFCTNLSRHGATVPGLIAAVRARAQSLDTAIAGAVNCQRS